MVFMKFVLAMKASTWILPSERQASGTIFYYFFKQQYASIDVFDVMD